MRFEVGNAVAAVAILAVAPVQVAEFGLCIWGAAPWWKWTSIMDWTIGFCFRRCHPGGRVPDGTIPALLQYSLQPLEAWVPPTLAMDSGTAVRNSRLLRDYGWPGCNPGICVYRDDRTGVPLNHCIYRSIRAVVDTKKLWVPTSNPKSKVSLWKHLRYWWFTLSEHLALHLAGVGAAGGGSNQAFWGISLSSLKQTQNISQIILFTVCSNGMVMHGHCISSKNSWSQEPLLIELGLRCGWPNLCHATFKWMDRCCFDFLALRDCYRRNGYLGATWDGIV